MAQPYLTETLHRFCTRNLYEHWKQHQSTYEWIAKHLYELEYDVISAKTFEVALTYMEKQHCCPSSVDALLDYLRRNPDKIGWFEKSVLFDSELRDLQEYVPDGMDLDDGPLLTSLYNVAKGKQHLRILTVSNRIAVGSSPLADYEIKEFFPNLKPKEYGRYAGVGPEAGAQFAIDAFAEGFGEVAEDDLDVLDMSGLSEVATILDEDSNVDTLYTYTMDSIAPKPLLWLWPDKIVAGTLTMICGAGGCGKTTCIEDWIARVTTGRDWPDGTKNTYGPRRVIFCSEEDDKPTVTIPRLIAAGADRSKIIGVKMHRRIKGQKASHESTLNLKNHIRGLNKLITDNPDIALLILDPLTSYMGGVKINDDMEVKPLLAKLLNIGQKTGITTLGLIHSNKRSDVNAAEKAMGAGSFVNSSRGVWTIAADADDPELYRMGFTKGNNVRKKTGIEFRIVSVDAEYEGVKYDASKIEWGAESTMTADDMLKAQRDSLRNKKEDKDTKGLQAYALVRSMLPAFAKDIFAQAKVDGLMDDEAAGQKLIYRAKDNMGAQTDKSRGYGKAYWYIPGEAGDPALKVEAVETFIPEEVLV